jgi:uncharacterized membrane protein YfcA
MVNEIDIYDAGLGVGAVTVSAQGISVDMSGDKVSTGLTVDVSATSLNVTSLWVQLEEWDGTTAITWAAIAGIVPGSIMSVQAGTATRQLLKTSGFRKHRYARANFLTVTGGTTTAGYTGVAALIIAQKENPAGAGAPTPLGTDRSPST